jgi:hypothetical protein
MYCIKALPANTLYSNGEKHEKIRKKALKAQKMPRSTRFTFRAARGYAVSAFVGYV